MEKTSNREKHDSLLDEGRFGKIFLMVLFIGSLAVFYNMVQIFLVNIILAAVFASIFYPLFRMFLKLFRGHRSISSFFSCAVILLCLIIPVVLILQLVAAQSLDLYHTAQPKLMEIIKKSDTSVLNKLKEYPLIRKLPISAMDWQSDLNEGVKFLGLTTAKMVNKTSMATISIVINIFLIFVTLFFFLRDGDKLIARVKELVPLSEEHKEMLVTRFASMSRAVIKGTLFVGLIQSTCGALTLMFFGVDSWALWWVVMTVLSVIPFVGTGAVLIPAGIIKIAVGYPGQGIAIILISVLFISSIDNILRPKFIGSDVGMHYLLIFFSIMGGIYVFGVPGFIIGPLVTAMFLTILAMYKSEFQEHIDYHKRKTTDGLG